MTPSVGSDLPILDVVADEPDNTAPALARLLIGLARREQDAADAKNQPKEDGDGWTM
jgi:hypothetical protein